MKMYSSYVRWMFWFLFFLISFITFLSIIFIEQSLYGYGIFMILIDIISILSFCKFIFITDNAIYQYYIFRIKKLKWSEINNIVLNKSQTLSKSSYVGSEIILINRPSDEEEIRYIDFNNKKELIRLGNMISNQIVVGYKHKVMLDVLKNMQIPLQKMVILDSREWNKLCNKARYAKIISVKSNTINYHHLNQTFNIKLNEIKSAIVAQDSKRVLVKRRLIVLSTKSIHYNDIYSLKYNEQFLCLRYKKSTIRKLKINGIHLEYKPGYIL